MVQVQPMPNFMRGAAPTIERWSCGTYGSKRGVQDDDSVGSGRAARELRIAEQPPAKGTNPDIEVVIGWPGIYSAGGGGFHAIVVTE